MILSCFCRMPWIRAAASDCPLSIIDRNQMLHSSASRVSSFDRKRNYPCSQKPCNSALHCVDVPKPVCLTRLCILLACVGLLIALQATSGLCRGDDGSGYQRWQLAPVNGNPGVYYIANVGREGCPRNLGSSACGGALWPNLFSWDGGAGHISWRVAPGA